MRAIANPKHQRFSVAFTIRGTVWLKPSLVPPVPWVARMCSVKILLRVLSLLVPAYHTDFRRVLLDVESS